MKSSTNSLPLHASRYRYSTPLTQPRRPERAVAAKDSRGNPSPPRFFVLMNIPALDAWLSRIALQRRAISMILPPDRTQSWRSLTFTICAKRLSIRERETAPISRRSFSIGHAGSGSARRRIKLFHAARQSSHACSTSGDHACAIVAFLCTTTFQSVRRITSGSCTIAAKTFQSLSILRKV